MPDPARCAASSSARASSARYWVRELLERPTRELAGWVDLDAGARARRGAAALGVGDVAIGADARRDARRASGPTSSST